METASSVDFSIRTDQPVHLRACAACSKAKAKCVIEEQGKCQRCSRLGRRCESAIGKPRSQPRKRKSEHVSRHQDSHVSKLEEKLDGLVTLLQQRQERPRNEINESLNLNIATVQSKSGSTVSTTSEPSPGGSSKPGWIHLEIVNSAINPQSWHEADPNTIPQITPSTQNPALNHPGSAIPDRVDISIEEANLLLSRWRDKMVPFFPFIIVDPSVSAEELHKDRPYLLKAILAVASHDPGQQLAIGKWLVRELADRLVVGLERNLDLLLGVLTYTGWCFYSCYSIPQLTCILSLGMGLIFDLGINRPPPSLESKQSPYEIALRETNNPDFPRYAVNVRTPRTLEDRRALLGMFFITSAASKFLRSKIDPLKMTPYIHECLTTLDEARNPPTDTKATFLVRLQIIVEGIGQGPWNHDYGIPEPAISSPPAILYVRSFQEQLKEIKSKMAPDMGIRGYLLMHFYNTEESLYEIALSKNTAISEPSTDNFHRLEMLYACLQSNKLFFDTLFAIPEYRYPSFNTVTWAQITHSLMILQLLSIFDHPGWDLGYVRETIDFMTVIDKLVENLRKLEGPVFARAATKLVSIKAHIEVQMADPQASGHGLGAAVPMISEDTDISKTWEPYDFLDESWLTDVLGPLDFQSNNAFAS